MSALSPQFLPTVSLNQKTLRKLASGLIVLRPGQWVRDPSTKRIGRFIAATGSIGHMKPKVCWYKPNEYAIVHARRLAESCWHTYRKMKSPELCVLGAPTATVTLAEVKRNMRKYHTGDKRVYV